MNFYILHFKKPRFVASSYCCREAPLSNKVIWRDVDTVPAFYQDRRHRCTFQNQLHNWQNIYYCHVQSFQTLHPLESIYPNCVIAVSRPISFSSYICFIERLSIFSSIFFLTCYGKLVSVGFSVHTLFFVHFLVSSYFGCGIFFTSFYDLSPNRFPLCLLICFLAYYFNQVIACVFYVTCMMYLESI